MKKKQRVVDFFSHVDKYVSNNPIIELRKRIFKEIIGDIKDSKILDVGCGDGSITMDFLKKNEVTFLDITKEMLDLTRDKIPVN